MSFRNLATETCRADAPPCRHGDAPSTARSTAAPTDHELDHQARAIAAVINASSKLQRLRNRTRALEHALARLKAQHIGMPA